jgi:hypothetical protein
MALPNPGKAIALESCKSVSTDAAINEVERGSEHDLAQSSPIAIPV